MVFKKEESEIKDIPEGVYGNHLSGLLASVLRVRRVAKTASDKITFLEYFKEQQLKNSKRK
jgi:hypothetical protein